MFHKVLLLSEGNPLYFGRGEDAMGYFSSIGFSPLVAMNPSDFLLDLANGMLSYSFTSIHQDLFFMLVFRYFHIAAVCPQQG